MKRNLLVVIIICLVSIGGYAYAQEVPILEPIALNLPASIGANQLGIQSISKSPTDNLITIISEHDGILLWNIGEDSETCVLQNSLSPETEVTWSADGQLIAAGFADSLKIWFVHDCSLRSEIVSSPISFAKFSSVGNNIAYRCIDCNSVQFWNLDTNEETSLLGAPSSMDVLEFNDNGNLLVGAGSDSIVVWDTNLGEMLLNLNYYSMDVAFSPDSSKLAVSVLNSDTIGVHIYDIENGNLVQICDAHLVPSQLQWLNNNTVFTIFNSQRLISDNIKYVGSALHGWNVEDCKEEYNFEITTEIMLPISLDNNERLAAHGEDIAWVENIETGEIETIALEYTQNLQRFDITEFEVTVFSINSNKSLIAVGTDAGNVFIWDLETGSLLAEAQDHSSQVYSLVWLSNYQLLSEALNSSIVAWDVSNIR